jgi:hypothetical protein
VATASSGEILLIYTASEGNAMPNLTGTALDMIDRAAQYAALYGVTTEDVLTAACDAHREEQVRRETAAMLTRARRGRQKVPPT